MSEYERRARVADWIGWVFVVCAVLSMLDAAVRIGLGKDTGDALASALAMAAVALAMRAHGAAERLRGRGHGRRVTSSAPPEGPS